jgi:flavin-dependent dehydrogenase
MIDIAVIGAGPAGSAAAKRCAEHGLETVILEKKRLPRDKVCSGMIIGRLAHTLIKQEFGDIPWTVLSRPPLLDGYVFHTPDVDNQTGPILDFSIPLTWRRNLDFWMTEKALAQGVQMLQGAKVTGILKKEQGFRISYESDQERHMVEARFIIGADGGTSMVRKYLYPQLKVPFAQAYEECHRGRLELDPRYFHWFYLQKAFPGGFAIHQKDDLVVLEFGGTVGVPKERVKWVKDYLATNYAFDQSREPVWRKTCAVARLVGGLVSGTFMPARENVLLSGEAGGFVLPITGEGIGTSLKSGLMAADSIAQAIKSGHPADRIYLKEIRSIITPIRDYSLWVSKIEAAAKGSADLLRRTLAGAHQASLTML